MKRETRLSCAYLYSDGTLLLVNEELSDGVRVGESMEVALGWAKSVRVASGWRERNTPSNGRLVLHRYSEGLFKLMKGAEVEAVAPSLDGGSENSKSRGISVGYLTVNTKAFGKLHWTFADILSSDVTIQASEQYAPREWTLGERWSTYPVVKITDYRHKHAA